MLGAYTRLARKPKQRRGVALVIVFATIALLSTSVIEYVYNTRVNLFLAQNHRDEVKAYFLARSGINLNLLALAYQNELAAQGGIVGRAVRNSNFQLWQYLDLLLPTFSSGNLSAEGLGSIDLGETGATGFGELFGTLEFERPEPEEGKINLNGFGSRELDQRLVQSFCALLRPPQYDQALGLSADRAVRDRFEVIAAIVDHIDPDSDLTQIDEECTASMGGAGNESSRYDDVEWEAKNEPLVTLDEVLMVPGVTDAFMEQFRHNLTVYPVGGDFFVNLADSQAFAGLLCANIRGVEDEYANPCAIPQVAAQVNFIALALEGWNKFFANPFNVLMMWVGGGGLEGGDLTSAIGNGQMIAFRDERDFVGVVNMFRDNSELALYFLAMADPQRALLFGWARQQGVDLVPPDFGIEFDEAGLLRNVSVDVPRIFTIRSTGRYGGASRTISAVADLRDVEPRLLYWREF
jgi:general secretion pathway protein K